MSERKIFDGFRALRVDTEVAEPGRRLPPRETANLVRKGINLAKSGQLSYHQQSGTHLDVDRNN